MAISRINVGTLANDGTGDDLRQAFVKVNNNFDELDLRVIPQNTASNLGTGQGVFYTKENNNLNFKSLTAGAGINLTSDAEQITITNDASLTIGTNGDNLVINTADKSFTISGGTGLTSSVTGSTITLDAGAGVVNADTNPTLSTDLDANNNDINNARWVNATTVNATAFNGALTGAVDGVDVGELGRQINGVDYGTFPINAQTGLELLFFQTTFSYGTITSPSALASDYGTIA
jgi:hypothetical protein